MLPQNLGPAELRVLGALIEKELATPDHYPLSLNSLIAACNQSTNREPITTLDQQAVTEAVTSLRRMSLVRSFQGSGERVPKYRHLLADADDLSRAHLAVLSVLMLRGPQTQSEVRTRAARLMPAEDSTGIDSALEALVERAPPAAVKLPRRPGQKEARYAHLLGGDVSLELADAADEPSPGHPAANDRITALEELARELRSEVSDLRSELAAFRKQFE